MRILAIDPSLTRTGWAGPSIDDHGVLIPPKGMDRGVQRLLWIRERVLDAAVTAELVVLEGYGFGPQRGHAAIELAELGGVLRVGLYMAGVPFVDVAPASLKKFATGKGNASKAEVLVAAVKRLGYDGADDNVADALWLWTMAMTAYGEPPVPMPAENREAVLRVQWARRPAALETAEKTPTLA